MNLAVRPASIFTLTRLAQLLNQAFRDYLVEVSFNEETLFQMMRQDSLDLNASGVVYGDDKQPAGIALIARRGRTSRLATFGIIPAARRQGLGRWFMEQLVIQAENRGERAMVLEVIEQNTAAVRLYQQLGFETRRRLVGYTARDPKGVIDPELWEIDLADVARALICWGPSDLPWQISGETLGQQVLPARGYRLWPAYAAISDPAQPYIVLKALGVEPGERRHGWATALMRALFAHYPGKTWKVPILCPENLAPGLFEQLGFVRESRTQFQMELKLAKDEDTFIPALGSVMAFQSSV
jgi:ribosomal protein S18 acetylase RimI-like enzyme